MTLDMYKTVVENALDGIVITSSDLNKPGPFIEYVNPAFTKLTGYAPHEVIGKSPRLLQGEKTDKKILREMKRDLPKKGYYRNEIVNYKKDGTPYVIEWHVAAIRNSSGEVIKYVSMQRDVTQRKAMENQLRDQNEKISGIVKERTQELLRTQERLKELNEQLQMRVESLEGLSTKLNDREKQVMAALCTDSNATDALLAQRLQMQRSTVASIRKRLLVKGYLEEKYIVHPEIIGVELIGFVRGKDSITDAMHGLGLVKKRFSNSTFAYVSNKDFFQMLLAKDVVEGYTIEREIDEEDHFLYPLKLCRVVQFFDYAPCICSLFDIPYNPIPEVEYTKIELTKNDVHVLKAYLNGAQPSLSPVTTRKSVKKLIESGALRKVYVPSFRMLNSAVVYIECTQSNEKLLEKLQPFIHLEWEDKCVAVASIPANDSEFVMLVEELYQKGELSEYPTIMVLKPRDIRVAHLHFSLSDGV